MKTFILILSFLSACIVLSAQPAPTDEDIRDTLKARFNMESVASIDNIMRFNNDTILVSGYLGDNPKYDVPKNTVYQTFNGGKTWKNNHFQGDAWIYNTHFANDGKVWMGGSDEMVHYSNDYGTTWQVKLKPFMPYDRVLSIYMADSLTGIAGGLENRLAITNNNWETTKQIPTPFDQGKYRVIPNSSRYRVEKVTIFGSVLLVNQNEHIYYSDIDKIEWKEFNIPVEDFSVNISNNTISIYSVRGKVFILDAKLNLLRTDLLPVRSPWQRTPANDLVAISEFLAPEIKNVQINTVEYKLKGQSDGCIRFPVYKAKEKKFRVNDTATLNAVKNILSSSNSYKVPSVKNLLFSEDDFKDYAAYYQKARSKRQEEKVWGGDFTGLVNIDHNLFLQPRQTIDMLDQKLIDTVYTTLLSQNYISDHSPSITIKVVNKHSDTLKITSDNAIVFSQPWKIEYKGRSFETYDIRITDLLKRILPKVFAYYDKLFGGELIYSLIEQRIINELEYKNSYKPATVNAR